MNIELVRGNMDIPEQGDEVDLPDGSDVAGLPYPLYTLKLGEVVKITPHESDNRSVEEMQKQIAMAVRQYEVEEKKDTRFVVWTENGVVYVGVKSMVGEQPTSAVVESAKKVAVEKPKKVGKKPVAKKKVAKKSNKK